MDNSVDYCPVINTVFVVDPDFFFVLQCSYGTMLPLTEIPWYWQDTNPAETQ